MTNHSNTHRNTRNQQPGRQTGGTLLGIIIGLVVGLGIALAVAVTITKTSLPFLNKPVKSEKAGELTPSQVADPNKPLYGNKEPAKEAAKDFVKPAETGLPTDTKAAPADKPAAAKPANGKPADAKPAESKDAAAAAAKSDTPDDKWTYYLQAGAFREQADAESTRARLALSGFEASVSERPSESGGPLYRVRLGPFSQLEAMNRVRSKLSDNGIDVAVVRIAK